VNIESNVTAYDGLTDLPFFLIDRETYRAKAKESGGAASFVCTIRPREDWVTSVISHGTAGGKEMFDFYRKALHTTTLFPYEINHADGTKRPALNYTFRLRSGTVLHPAREVLGKFYDWWLDNRCPHEQERIWLNGSDSDLKWSTLCNLVPARFQERCQEVRRRQVCWPHLHGSGAALLGVQTDRPIMKARSFSVPSQRCTPWPQPLCYTRKNSVGGHRVLPPPADRRDGGSIEGNLMGTQMLDHIVCCSEGRPQAQADASTIIPDD
jgi:hypothetical protein